MTCHVIPRMRQTIIKHKMTKKNKDMKYLIKVVVTFLLHSEGQFLQKY